MMEIIRLETTTKVGKENSRQSITDFSPENESFHFLVKNDLMRGYLYGSDN
jgi:hypothetical protein